MSGVRVVGPPDRPQVYFTANQNADFETSIQLLDDADQPVDLSAAHVSMGFKLQNEPTNALQLAEGSGLTITGSTIAVLVTAAQHATMQVGEYLFDLVLTVGSQTPQLMEGVYRLVPGVTVT